jgi:hypothetical protein
MDVDKFIREYGTFILKMQILSPLKMPYDDQRVVTGSAYLHI